GRKKNIELLRSRWKDSLSGEFRFIESDLTTLFAFHGSRQIDQIYHLACPASPQKYYLNHLKTLDICYLGTKNALEIARQNNSQILFSSTSEIYGDPLEHPQKENYNGNVNPVSPRSVYDEGKRVAETLVSEYHRQYGL